MSYPKPNFVEWCRKYRTEHPGCSLGEARDAYEAQFGPRLTDKQALQGLLQVCDRVSEYAVCKTYVEEMNTWAAEVRSHFDM